MPDTESSLAAALSDRYRIDRVLGEGGMATVYLAHDLKHDRPVALKVLKPDLAHALGPERFEREIRLAARLQHPHVLTVLDSGEVEVEPQAPGVERQTPDARHSTLLYFTMPYVEGESLRDRLIREKQLPLEDALRIAREAAQALQYAHEHGVLHRDIKPENLLLTRDGSTLVADFGIARALGASGPEALTQTGMALGTPAYMSPEQASAEADISPRTDVYSLGAVLYEMLAGEPPFTGPTAQAVIAKRFSGAVPSVRAARANVPEAIDQAVTRALAVVPADRWPSAAELARALAPGATTAVPASARPRRLVSPTTLALVLGLLVGGGALFAWQVRQQPGASGQRGPRRIAVLPFVNVGDSADAYFADGITDAVRGKLASLTGVEVIASGSSNDYRGSTKGPKEIAAELNVEFLLEGKVRWAKASDGSSRVQVSPELIRASTAAVAWQQPFDASLTDVFRVQADIASQVASALDVALADSVRGQLAQRPTGNLAAYDAFLRAEQLLPGGSNGLGAGVLRRAITYLEQATALDSSFALAWARLAETRASLFSNGTPSAALGNAARDAAEKAVALAPSAAYSHLAMGRYYFNVVRDARQAAAEVGLANRLAPGDARVVNTVSALEAERGQWDSALVHARRAVLLDPRSPAAADRLALQLLWLRRYDEARAVLDRALALAPANLNLIEDRAMVELGEGDLAGARAVLASVPRTVDPADLVAYLANYWDLYWVLDEAQQALLLQLSPRAFDNDAAGWNLVAAQTLWLRGDTVEARLHADSARVALEKQLGSNPDDAQRLALHGLMLAYLGQAPDAIKEAEQAARLWDALADQQTGPYLHHLLARVLVLAGESERAIDELTRLLRAPYFLSPGWLRIDPSFAPLRSSPRFQQLTRG